MVERLIERSSCWCGELYSLQCGRRSRAWRRSVCEVGVGELCVVVGRRWCGSRRCGWRLLVAISANCCDTWWSISASKLGVLCRRSILSHCACRQLASRQHRSKTTGEQNCTSFGQRLFTHLFCVIIVSFTTETSHSVKVSFSTVLFSRGNVDRCCFWVFCRLQHFTPLHTGLSYMCIFMVTSRNSYCQHKFENFEITWGPVMHFMYHVFLWLGCEQCYSLV